MALQSRVKTRVKICGITHLDDAQAVVDAGADAMGLVFYQPSPRCVDVKQARQLAQLVGPFVTVVGLFVDADQDFVNRVLEAVPLHLLQFHGNESESYCEQFGRPYLKVLRMKPDLDINGEINKYPRAAGVMLDTYEKNKPGGTGEAFDWHRVPQRSERAIIVAGGLSVANVERAIAASNPYGVDVSGGVEFTPGRKDARKVAEFTALAKR